MWTETEKQAYEWFKNNYDNQAKFYGQSDSTKSDIFSPQFNGYIEIKQLCPFARCGQFTRTTALYPVCKDVINGIWNEDNAKEFVKLHYNKKQVIKFLIITENDYKLEDFNDFLNNYKFQWQHYAKKSGTRSTAKKYYNQILSLVPSELKNNKIYITDDNLIGKYFWIGNNEFFVSKTATNYKEIRQCSKTKNETWLVEVSK